MREKLLELMKCEGLKPSQLALMLEIKPAGISHILAGRNKPGFDLLQKILRRFPRLNPDWLILDSGAMYRDASSNRELCPKVNTGLFDAEASTETQIAAETLGTNKTPNMSVSDFPFPELSSQASDAAAIERIVVFYTDQTFVSFHPKK